ncbi:hypothetical protein Taro_037391, partial [Colocasia esculenta]|nr:hypothetical protein [Colocasia esculenta]
LEFSCNFLYASFRLHGCSAHVTHTFGFMMMGGMKRKARTISRGKSGKRLLDISILSQANQVFIGRMECKAVVSHIGLCALDGT